MINSKRKRDDEEGEERESQSLSKFKCTTCSKEFSTFQALGGHRASHTHKNPNYALKKLSHECRICHKQFETGQALGGHMTNHREKGESSKGSSSKSDVIQEEKYVGERFRCDRSALVTLNFFPMEPMWANAAPVKVVPVLERVDSWLDFKLAPLGGDFNKKRD